MKMKWLVSISLICAMSVSSAVSVYAAAEEISAEDVFVTFLFHADTARSVPSSNTFRIVIEMNK